MPINFVEGNFEGKPLDSELEERAFIPHDALSASALSIFSAHGSRAQHAHSCRICALRGHPMTARRHRVAISRRRHLVQPQHIPVQPERPAEHPSAATPAPRHVVLVVVVVLRQLEPEFARMLWGGIGRTAKGR